MMCWLAPLRSRADYDWYHFQPKQDIKFSIVVCDGPPASTRGGRSGLAAEMKRFLAPDFKIYIDDVERPSEREALSAWARALGKLSVRIDSTTSKKSLGLVTPG